MFLSTLLQVNVTANTDQTANATTNIWLTSDIHKIRIVIDGNPGYVNTHRTEILQALRTILGTDIVWIESVGYYTKEGSVDITK